MPKVSVIVPVYGVEEYIERCARSLFEQTLDDIEYLFIDDCTPDRSIEILNQVLEEYPHRKSQVVLHRMEQNSGQAVVRKWGMQNATGEYIIHCDSDDWVDRDMYRAMYDKAKEEDVDLVVCDYITTDGVTKNRYKGCLLTNYEAFMRDCFSKRISWSLWNKLMRLDLLQRTVDYPTDNMGEDMATTLQFLLFAKSVAYIELPYYYYYYNPLSITNSTDENVVVARSIQCMKNVRIVLETVKKEGLECFLKDEVIFLKWHSRHNLWQLADKKQYFVKWLQMWPEIDRYVLTNKYIPFDEKVKYVLTFLRLYPVIPRLIRSVAQKKSE